MDGDSGLSHFDDNLYGTIETIFDTQNPYISLFLIAPHHIAELLWDQGWFFQTLFAPRDVISRFPWPLAKLSVK